MGQTFSANKLKVQLKMAVTRIGISKNKKANANKVLMREIADMLRNGKEEAARIKVEQVIREDQLYEAFEIMELMCELLYQRINLIALESTCPQDLIEATATLIYSANRVQIPELSEVQKQLGAKYGVEFAQRHAQNLDGCVNPRVVNKLGIQPPALSLVLKYLDTIAKQYSVDWECPPDIADAPQNDYGAGHAGGMGMGGPPTHPGGYPGPAGGGGGGMGYAPPQPHHQPHPQPQNYGPPQGGAGGYQQPQPQGGYPQQGGLDQFPSVPTGTGHHNGGGGGGGMNLPSPPGAAAGTPQGFPSTPQGFPSTPQGFGPAPGSSSDQFPSVPKNGPSAGGGDGNVPDFDDLSARFAALKK